MPRVKNFHSKHYRTKKLDPGKGTKGSFGRGLKGLRDAAMFGAIFPEAAFANAVLKGFTGEGLEGFEDPQKKRKGGVVRCVDKSDKPQKIKKTKKVAKRGQRGVGAAKRGFGRAVV